MTHEINVTWDEYHKKIEYLAQLVQYWDFNQIVCIARGGLRPGDILSRIYNCPLAIMSAESYDGATQRDTIKISYHMSMTRDLGSRVLLVDDIADTGQTLEEALKYVKTYDVDEIRTAVLWTKKKSTFTPDYSVKLLKDNPIIVQPFAHYELS